MTKSKKTILQKKHARLQSEQFEKSLNNPPRSIIFRRGVIGDSVKKLIRDLRWVMSPFTAKKLRDTANNTIKDFLKIAGPYQVTHFMVLLQTAAGLNLKVTRIPRGPSLYFRVLEYTTMESIRAKQKQVNSYGSEYKFAPLVVLNNFSGPEDHKRIMAAVFQNMFPALDITTMRLACCRRVVMINYNSDSDTIDFRHYEISAVPVGLTKGIRKIIKGKLVDLHNRDDIADYVDNPNTMSDSEAELPEDARVTLSQSVHGRGNLKQQTSAIKLKELGPRMTLQLFKIEEGLFEGNVMYHKFVTKTEAEAKEIARKQAAKRAEKDERKTQQEANVLRKQQDQEAREKVKNEKRAAREAARALIAKDEYDESDSESDSDDDEVVPDYKHSGPIDADDDDEEEDGDMAFGDSDQEGESEGNVIEFDDEEEESEEEPAPKKGRFNKRK